MTVGLNRRVAPPTLHVALREELQARGWGVAKLAEVLGVRFGVASRWVAENPSKRVVPLPGTLVQIADTFQLDVVEVFRKAGYLPALDEYPPDERDREIDRLGRSFLRALRTRKDSATNEEWAEIIATTEIILSHYAALLNRIDL